MIDVQIIRQNILLELREKFVRIASSLRRLFVEERNHFCRIGLRANALVAKVLEMLDQKIDNAITKLAHLVSRKRKARSVSR